MHAFGVDDDASLSHVLFPIAFLEWVTSAKRYRVTFAERLSIHTAFWELVLEIRRAARAPVARRFSWYLKKYSVINKSGIDRYRP